MTQPTSWEDHARLAAKAADLPKPDCPSCENVLVCSNEFHYIVMCTSCRKYHWAKYRIEVDTSMAPEVGSVIRCWADVCPGPNRFAVPHPRDVDGALRWFNGGEQISFSAHPKNNVHVVDYCRVCRQDEPNWGERID